MFLLDAGLPASLRPGARPRTTLSTTIARKGDTWLAFGTPGGDQQGRWQLIWLLRHVHHGARPAARHRRAAFQSSSYPRSAQPGALTIELGIAAETVLTLRGRGHLVEVARPRKVGRLTAPPCAIPTAPCRLPRRRG